MTAQRIPFLDLDAQFAQIGDEVKAAIDQVLQSKKFVQNEFCRQFARDFLAVHGGDFGVGCSNGTSALTLSLKAAGVGPGDEVITTNNTFFATVEAIASVGARPVLVDCLADTYGIDPEGIRKALTKKTRALIVVHLYGNPCRMDDLCEITRESKVNLIEDCAQAHLATYKNKPVGTFGRAGTFSFYPGKNLGACGDAGFVLASDEDFIKQVAMQLNHGRITKYEHQFMAGNDRMDDLQAAILSVKCKHIAKWTNRRILVARKYDELLKPKGHKVIEILPQAKCVYHQYVIEVDNRSEVMACLQENGIGHGIHYPVPMNLQPACAELGYGRGDFPVSQAAAGRILSLPMYPEMSDEAIKRVANLL